MEVTATYLPDTTITDVIIVTYGKGSEILFDFENGEHELFLGVDEMYDWAAEVGASAPIQTNGNYSEDADSETFLAFKQYILVNYDTIDSTTIKY